MCFVHGWYWWSRVSAMATWLSENRVVGDVMLLNTSEMRLHSHKASLPPCVAATYLLSVVDKEMISCHFEDHEIVPPSMRKA